MYSSCRPLPCDRLSRSPWWGVTPTTPMAAVSPCRSRGVGDPVVRRCGTYEHSLSASTHPLKDLVGPRSRPRSGPAHGSCRSRTCHRLQAFYRWVRTFTPSGFGFKQSSFTPRRRVLRTPCPTTLSSMRRFPGMLGHRQFSPPAMPVTQEPLLSSSCLQQGYHNAPHGAHRACGLSLHTALHFA
jgi:hypothetical protein